MTDRYRLGSYNVRKGRPARRVAREVARAMRAFRLDALCLQECATQLPDLHRWLPDHLRVVGYPNTDVAGRDSAIVVDMRRAAAAGRRVFGKRRHRMGGLGWERAARNAHKGLHNHREVVSVRLGRLRLASDHFPPTPHLGLYPMRDRAHKAMADRVAVVSQRWSRGKRANAGAWAWFGDKNMLPHVPRAAELARDSGGHIAHVVKRPGIDWMLAGPALRVPRIRRVRRDWLRADHGLVIAVVEVDR